MRYFPLPGRYSLTVKKKHKCPYDHALINAVDETLIGASFRSGTKNARLPQGDIPCGRSFFSLVQSQLLSPVRKKLMHSSSVNPSISISSYLYSVMSLRALLLGSVFTTTGLSSVLIAIRLVFIPRVTKTALSVPGISTDSVVCPSPSMTSNWNWLLEVILNRDLIECQYLFSSLNIWLMDYLKLNQLILHQYLFLKNLFFVLGY